VWGLLRENSRLLDHFTSLLTAAGPLGMCIFNIYKWVNEQLDACFKLVYNGTDVFFFIRIRIWLKIQPY
jgi:hypothetical protein